MTPANGLFLLLIFTILFSLVELWKAANRCGYCGTVNGHDDGCPYGRV